MGRTFAWLFLVSGCAQLSSATAQGAPVDPAGCPDKVSVTEFTRTTPSAALNWTFIATLKSLCSAASAPTGFSVPWRITVDGQTTPLGAGLIVIPPGGTAVAAATWPIAAGTFSFNAEVDPGNSLGEPALARANNLTTGLNLTVTPSALQNAMDHACAMPDRVQLTAFTLSPAVPARGQPVTLSLGIRNACGFARSIAWRVTLGGATLLTGTSINVPAGGNAIVTRSWVAPSGSHSLSAEIDPENATNEPASARANNKSANALTLTIPSS